jgi:hypothetical protein
LTLTARLSFEIALLLQLVQDTTPPAKVLIKSTAGSGLARPKFKQFKLDNCSPLIFFAFRMSQTYGKNRR